MNVTRRTALLSTSAAIGTFLASAKAGIAQAGDPADIVLTNARITTMDAARPEATALAARDGVFIAVGSHED